MVKRLTGVTLIVAGIAAGITFNSTLYQPENTPLTLTEARGGSSAAPSSNGLLQPQPLGGPVCTPPDCPSNAAAIDGHAIGPVHLGHHDTAFYIEPVLHPHGIPIDIADGEIVRRDPVTGTTAPIPGEDLLGSYLVLRRSAPVNGRTLWMLRLRAAAVVRLWVDRGGEGAEGEYAMAYEFALPRVFLEEPTLCPLAMPWRRAARARYAARGRILHAARPSGPRTVNRANGRFPVESWDEPSGRYAVLIKGETYDETTATVASSGESGARWFNIGCSGTALGKLKLMGYDPQEDRFPTTPDQRQATLKMITARYCPNRPELSFTVNGLPLAWQNAQRWFDLGDAYQVRATEALWNRDGATCLNDPRTREATALTADDQWTREEVEQACGMTFERCDDAVGLHGDEWTIPPGADWISVLYD